MSDDNLAAIEAAAYRYARRHGATPEAADEISGMVMIFAQSCTYGIIGAKKEDND